MKITERELAEKIARRLFLNGNGELACRLVLELPDRRFGDEVNRQSGGGWCETSVVEEIKNEIHLAVLAQVKLPNDLPDMKPPTNNDP